MISTRVILALTMPLVAVSLGAAGSGVVSFDLADVYASAHAEGELPAAEPRASASGLTAPKTPASALPDGRGSASSVRPNQPSRDRQGALIEWKPASFGFDQLYALTNRAFIRITADKVEVAGALRRMRLSVAGRPQLVLNGRLREAWVEGGVLAFSD